MNSKFVYEDGYIANKHSVNFNNRVYAVRNARTEEAKAESVAELVKFISTPEFTESAGPEQLAVMAALRKKTSV